MNSVNNLTAICRKVGLGCNHAIFCKHVSKLSKLAKVYFTFLLLLHTGLFENDHNSKNPGVRVFIDTLITKNKVLETKCM